MLKNIMKSIARFLAPVVIVVIGMAVFAAFLFTQPKAIEQPIEERAWVITSEKIHLASHTPVIKLLGVVQSPHPTQLTAAIEAEVLKIAVNAGDQVTLNQTLIVLEQDEAQFKLTESVAKEAEIKALIKGEAARYKNDQANFKSEESLLQLAKRAVERAKDLEQRNLASRSQLDEAQQNRVRQQITLQERRYRIAEYPSRLAQLNARLQQAAAQQQRAMLDLEHTLIKAPFNGKLVDIKVGVGERIKKGNVLIKLYKQDELEVKAKIPLRYMDMIYQAIDQAIPLPVWVKMAQQRYALTLVRIAASIDPGQGSVDCFFTFDKKQINWPTGLNVELHLSLEAVKKSALLPLEALYGTDMIYRIEQNRLQALKIKVLGHAINQEGHAQLIIQSNQLNDDDTILTTKFANAINGLKVIRKATE